MSSRLIDPAVCHSLRVRSLRLKARRATSSCGASRGTLERYDFVRRSTLPLPQPFPYPDRMLAIELYRKAEGKCREHERVTPACTAWRRGQRRDRPSPCRRSCCCRFFAQNRDARAHPEGDIYSADRLPTRSSQELTASPCSPCGTARAPFSRYWCLCWLKEAKSCSISKVTRSQPPTDTVRLTSDRGFLVLEELVPDETHDQTGLSHRRVSEQDQLEVAHSPRRHVAAAGEVR